MKTEKVIQMIDEYLLEPNSIHKDWVEALQMCKKALVECEGLRAEIESLESRIFALNGTNKMLIDSQEIFWKNRVKEFAERLKEVGTPVEGGKGFEGVFVMVNNLQIDNLVKEMVGKQNE